MDDIRLAVEQACRDFQVRGGGARACEALPASGDPCGRGAASVAASAASLRSAQARTPARTPRTQDPTRMAGAEAVLVAHLRDAPHALAAARHVVAASALPEARFHAAVALKRALALCWPGLGAEEVRAAPDARAARAAARAARPWHPQPSQLLAALESSTPQRPCGRSGAHGARWSSASAAVQQRRRARQRLPRPQGRAAAALGLTGLLLPPCPCSAWPPACSFCSPSARLPMTPSTSWWPSM